MADRNLNETFVFKLYRMVEESRTRLICWNQDGTSFIVTNAMEFARDVLPKYFKHNNFSSYVRQLNMYGFHKVNDTPKSSKVIQDSQVWEFSHPKFIRGRTDILNDIKRRVVSNTTLTSTGSRTSSENEAEMGTRKERDDLVHQLNITRNIQSDTAQQLSELQSNYHLLYRELSETKRKQAILQEGVKKMIEVLNNHQAIISHGTAKPFELQDFGLHELDSKFETSSPFIVVSSSPDYVAMKEEVLEYEPIFYQSNGNNPHSFHQQPAHSLQQQQSPGRSSSAFLPTQAYTESNYFHQPKLAVPSQYPAMNNPRHQRSGSYNTAVNTPLPPSPVISPIASPGYQSSLTDDDPEDEFMDEPDESGSADWSQGFS